MAERLLNLFATFDFSDEYFVADPEGRRDIRRQVVEESRALASASHFYTTYPARADSNFMIWSAIEADEPSAPGRFFAQYAEMCEGWGAVRHNDTLWGMTRPSMYSRGKSEQDMDPVAGPRAPYLIVYPFSKTKDWYLMSMDARQGQMNEHIKLGKQYFDIKQLLLYSFGLQDQEFVVSYETEDLARFSELVQALRSTEARRYTENDTPIITGIYRSPEEFIR